MTILDRIVETKREEVAIAKTNRPVSELCATADRAERPRDFAGGVSAGGAPGVRLIAELKQRSPSAGLIVPDFDPAAIAAIYAKSGAAALSVLTDATYFGGRLETINLVKEAVALPVLRKDFFVDEYQIVEARAAGADAILLIAEVLDAGTIDEFTEQATEWGMSVLVEVHSEDTLRSVLDVLGPPGTQYLLGINNRDLTAQKNDLSTMARLAKLLPSGTRFVAESGIADRDDVRAAADAGACGILVGESLLRSADIGAKIDSLLR